jgi:hypothetical protein
MSCLSFRTLTLLEVVSYLHTRGLGSERERGEEMRGEGEGEGRGEMRADPMEIFSTFLCASNKPPDTEIAKPETVGASVTDTEAEGKPETLQTGDWSSPPPESAP